MPPRRKQKGRKKAAEVSSPDEPPPKLPRADSENTQLKKEIIKVEKKEEEVSAAQSGKSSCKLDDQFLSLLGDEGRVYGEYGCMLSQTNISDNNNKYYVIQLAKVAEDEFKLFTRWGRVGEDGKNSVEEFTEEAAIKSFKAKFQSKTGNNWDKRADFTPKTKKYTLLIMDMEESDDEGGADIVDGVVKVKQEVKPHGGCALPLRTQLMVKLIFNSNMFESQMEEMQLDIRKMPLGKLSKTQIAKGLAVLIQLEELLKNKKKDAAAVAALSSQFFTAVPHNFGRSRPPLLDDPAIIQQKKDVMITLSDIELTQGLLAVKKEKEEKHPLDAHYESLKCQMKLINKTSNEFKVIDKYVKAAKSKAKLVDVWCLDREGEQERFSVNDGLAERKLLWHGTGVAVVAAILNSGLRIMPHSGGRVGRGIYFASEHSKSAGYTRCHYDNFEGEKNIAFMFLSEVALGKINEITRDDGSLKKAPAGYNSVVARGSTEPDAAADTSLKLDGRVVCVPVGGAVAQKAFKQSSFHQSEYLIYNEHQARLRFLLKFAPFH